MARQALIKLRRGTGLPANNVLAEGELAIDIAAKKLYSANSNGQAFTLSGDQYNLEQSGNSSHGIITLTVDNAVLSNDNILITGGTDITVAGNSSTINVNSTSTLDSVLGRGSTSTSTIGVGNTTITGFANVTSTLDVASATTLASTLAAGNTTITGFANVTTDLHVGTTSQFDGNVTVGNSTVNAVITSAGNIDTDGTLTVAGLTDLNGNLEVAGTSTLTGNVSTVDDVSVGGDLTVTGNLTVQGTTTQVSSTTVTIDDPLIKLAANQTATDADAVDTGIYMTFDASDTQYYSGIFRDQNNSNKAWVFVEGLTAEPGTTVTYSASDLAYIEAIIDGGTY